MSELEGESTMTFFSLTLVTCISSFHFRDISSNRLTSLLSGVFHNLKRLKYL